MLIYILIVHIYRVYAKPIALPLPPSSIASFPSLPSSSLVVPSVSPLAYIQPRTPSVSGRNTCSTGERGPFDIIWSCTATLFACIYKALHPNVPSQELGWRGRLWIKMKLAFLMLFAPELVVVWAAAQWVGARKIAKEMNAIDKDIKWTTAHGHFVQMLAFGRKDNRKPHVWEEKDIPDSVYGNKLALKYLYSEGYIELDSLRSIKEEDIMDRSKGDFISKLFAILQTSWFILGCIARHHKRLPLTELEVITLASAVINGALYILWWNKPQNVVRRQYLTIRTEPGDKPEPPLDIGVPPSGMRIAEWYRSFTENQFQCIHQQWSEPELSSDTENLGILMYRNGGPAEDWLVDLWFSLLGPFGTEVIGTKDDISLTRNAQYFYVDILKGDFGSVLGMTSVFTGVFGAIHFIAWDLVFPSRTELILWRVSCLVLLISPTVSMSLYSVYVISDIDFVGAMGAFDAILSIPFLVFARFCIIVLAFIALRKPDPGFFVDISWTCYIPHL